MGTFFPAPLAFAFLLIFLTACAAGPEERSPVPGFDQCVSAEGQRFLTYCASPEAARFARRQQTIQRAADGELFPEDMVPLPVEGAPLYGPADAALTIHLFSDLRCGPCRPLFDEVLRQADAHPDRIRLVFRHLPADHLGEDLARAALASAEQGKLWDFLRLLHEEPPYLHGDDLHPLLAELELDLPRFQNDLQRRRLDELLARDRRLASEVDVVAAPTLFVNGRRLVSPVDSLELQETIDEELRFIDEMEDAGLSGSEISWRRILKNYRPVNWEAVAETEEELRSALTVHYVPVEDSPLFGASPENARVTAVLFIDLECPYSAQAFQSWQTLLETFAPQGLRVAIKHFPLSIHPGAERAARAGIVAHEEDAFPAFIEALFQSPGPISEEELQRLHHRLGIEQDFHRAISDQAVEARLLRDLRLGADVQVQGTPTVFINGIQLIGVLSPEELTPLIADQLQLAETLQELTSSGGEELYRELVEVNAD